MSNILRIFKADESIVNCIQLNPYTCMIATSGTDPHIKKKKKNFFIIFIFLKGY
jgi:hypothetical protein